MKTINAVIIECAGPLCWTNGISMSMSGITDSMRTMGMLRFVFSIFAVALLEMYPIAKWPTANDLFSSSLARSESSI